MKNPYQFEVTCSVCGCGGVGTIQTAAAEWCGAVSHKDPEVCRRNLERRK